MVLARSSPSIEKLWGGEHTAFRSDASSLLPAEALSFAKLKRCRVMDVLRLVATLASPRDGTISGPVVVLTPATGLLGARYMPKCRQALADALALLVFGKPLVELNRSERAELNFLRKFDLEVDGEDAKEVPEKAYRTRAGAVTLH